MSPKLLPLINTRHGSRSAKTCEYRCANQCDAPTPNTSGNEEFQTLAQRAIARRAMLTGSAGAMVLAGFGAQAAAADTAHGHHPRPERNVGRASFTSVAPNRKDDVVNAEGFTHDVIIRWGDPVTKRAPRFDVHHQTPEAQAQQFGYNNDYVGIIPLDGRRALLSVNHEYTDPELMFPTGTDELLKKKIEMAAHGLAVVAIEKGRAKGSWKASDPRRSRYNRRITASTPLRVDGPAAGHELLRTKADPKGTTILGTFANCSGGTTPWGTTLHGEENFHGYFDASGALDPKQADAYKRYGITGQGKGWKDVDERFDLTKTPNEANRFGWIVELDPLDPSAPPVKHTMLGRVKHEGCNVTIARDGRVVAYTGDDEKGEYIYKFVSRDRYQRSASPAARRHNKTLLSAGTLYVAKFTGDGDADGVHDGTGTWIPLTSEKKSYVPGMSVAEVLVHTRLAADKVGPTRMDRPEDIEPNPVNGKIYCALTNNSDRGKKFTTDEANPLASSMTRKKLGEPLTATSGNRNGYILEVTEGRGRSCGKGYETSTDFTWDLMLICGDPAAQETYFAGFPKEHVSPISCPDNVAFDAVGNLWISTDGNQLGSNDGLFRVPTNGPERGRVQQFLTVPFGAETCGPLVSPDQLSVFTAVQHPGETDDATFEKPTSTWPHTDAFPRPSVIVSYAK
ncbi:MAG: phosphatase [Dermacoccus nishinomiyaensis]|nr:MAG: phosphatase [Dermacoccus nishinomiyaensis]